MRKIFTLAAAVLASLSMWAATSLADLNFEIKTGDTSLPENYTYSTSNTPSIKIQNNVTCIIISDGGGSTAPTFNGSAAPSNGKRWMAFCPDTDCSATISVMSNKKEFFIQDKSGKFFTYTNTANAVEEVVVNNLKANEWYAMCGGSSQVYVSKIVFAASGPTYTLSFNANGHGTAPDAITGLESGATPAKPADPEEIGWIFGGWYNKADWQAADAEAWDWTNSTVTQDTTLYAKWTEDTSITKYSVTYVLNGPEGDAPTQADAAENAVITLADAPTWEGHTFLGWSDGTNTYDGGANYTMPAQAVTFTAQWCTSLTPILSYDYTTVYPGFTADILPTLEGNTGNGAVSYAGSNDEVATVDAGTGAVTPIAAGSVIITATVVAAGEYCEATATATIIVTAAPEKMIVQKLATGDKNYWDASDIATKDIINITNLVALSQHGTAQASGNGKSGMTAKIATDSLENADNYLELSFTVAEGKELVVSEIVVPVQPVTSNTNNFKAVLSDNKGSEEIIGTATNKKNGELANIGFTSYGTLSGTITLRIYAWGWKNGYRLGEKITIDGTINEISTALQNTANEAKAVKVLRNGQLFIEKNGVLYNAQGVKVIGEK